MIEPSSALATLAKIAPADPIGIARDLAALIRLLRIGDPAAGQKTLSAARAILLGDAAAQAQLDVAEQLASSEATLPFGPVAPDAPAAVERLALFTIAAHGVPDFALFRSAVDDFGKSAGDNSPSAARMGLAVQTALFPSLDSLRWRREAVPAVLRHCFTALEPVLALAGGSLPPDWTGMAEWVRPWALDRDTIDPLSPDSGSDVFFGAARPLCLHPLVLALLEPRVRSLLDGPGSPEAIAFCEFVDRSLVQDSSGETLPKETPEVTLGAAAFLARQRTSPEVAAIADRSLSAIAAGFEVRSDLPAGWAGKEALRVLLDACPDWAGAEGDRLRQRVRELGRASTAGLAQLQATAHNLVPAATIAADLDQEVAAPRRTTARIGAVAPLRALAPALRGRARAIAAAGDEVERRASGLLGESLISVLAYDTADEPPTNAIAHEYWSRRIAALSPQAVREALAMPGWAMAVQEEVGPDLLPPTLDPWNALRGYLVLRSDATALDLATSLAGELPKWLIEGDAGLPDAIDVPALRPVVAAIGLLGMPAQGASGLPAGAVGPALISRAGALLANITELPPGLPALLAALRIDLSIASLSAMASPAISTVGLRSRRDLDHFAEHAATAFASPSAWERRAGLNGFALLSRLAEISGDPFTGGIAMSGMPEGAGRLVAASVARLLAPAPTGETASALPLGLAASSLLGSFRDQARGLALGETPDWLANDSLPTGSAGDLIGLIERLSAAFVADPAILSRFAWEGGHSGRALLLALFQIAGEDLALQRRLTIDPPQPQALARLRGLRTACRRAMSVERAVSGAGSGLGEHEPWWSLRYWSGGPALSQASDRVIGLVNWIESAGGNLRRQQLAMAATLSGDIPIVSPDRPSDVDLRSPFSLPIFSFTAAQEVLAAAKLTLKEEEDRFESAVQQQQELDVASDMEDLLRQPLLLNTVDAEEQVAAADAEVRGAQADLSAAEHDIAAAEYEVAGAALIYAAARIELEAQAVREEIAKLEVQIAGKQAEANDLAVEQGLAGQALAEIRLKRANALRAVAEANRQKAQLARQEIRKTIDLLIKLLRTPVQIQPDQPATAKGLIGRTGVLMRQSVERKLDADLAEAQASLEAAQAAAAAAAAAEAHRRAIAKQRGFFKSLFSVAGAVVGAVIGGPAGATLGASIAGAATDFISGIATDQPLDALFVDLAQSALSAAQAAGNFNGLIASIGNTTGAEADKLFARLDADLRPVLRSLPQIVDVGAMRDAFTDLQVIGSVGPLVDGVLGELRAANVPGDLRPVLAAAGITDLVGLPPGDELLQSLQNVLGRHLAEAGLDPATLASLARLAGTLPSELAKMAERLSKLLATRLQAEGEAARKTMLQRWLAEQQRLSRKWADVAAEGERLVASLFPDRAAQREVLANLKASLPDPELIVAQLRTMMIPWQDGLERKIAEAREAGEAVLRGLPDNSSALQVAQARIGYITATRDKMKSSSGLFAFLEGAEGASQTRDQLLSQLDTKLAEEAPAELDLEITQLQIDVAELDEDAALVEITLAQKLVEQLQKRADEAELNVEVASWQNKLVAIAGEKLETIADAEAASEQAARQRAEAAADRKLAAEAVLSSRVALAAAARQRASEGRRIRHALSRPLLRLDQGSITAGQMSRARESHLRELEKGFGAARDLLRLVRAISPTGSPTSLRPPRISDAASFRWSEFLEEESDELNRIFQPAGSDFQDTQLIDLSTEQIQALLPDASKRVQGLSLIFRPGAREALDEDRIVRGIADHFARNGAMALLLLTGEAKDGTQLSDHFEINAEYLGDHWVSPDTVHFIGRSRVSKARSAFVDRESAADPQRTFNRMLETAAQSGDIGFVQTRGTPLSGTTVLRLKIINQVEIARLSLSVLLAAENIAE